MFIHVTRAHRAFRISLEENLPHRGKTVASEVSCACCLSACVTTLSLMRIRLEYLDHHDSVFVGHLAQEVSTNFT